MLRDARDQFEWLLRHRLGSVLQRMDAHVAAMLSCVEAAKRVTLAVTSGAQSDAVKGTLSLEGTSLVKGDLTLKLPHFRVNPLKVSLATSHPLNLPQLSTFKQTALLARARIDSLKATIDAYAADTSSSSADSIDITWLFNEFTSIGNIVREAAKSLRVVNEERLFPLKECDGKTFSPELPDDLIVEFYLSGVSSLAVSIYAVGYHSQSNAAASALQMQSQILLSRFKNMKIEKYKGRAIEILDEIYIESKIPSFSNLEVDMNGCIQLSDSALVLMKALLH